ncbi:IclR family transcriptional regulator [Desulfonema ishimotonii]|uniref:IclR family transcriptional regulator n=1 Tax=Desulfonema ishimotonii TaxID=45657 RepID=A0A401FZM5_9BACT|nr:IclR family transcriptional regulator [Desulfonema ishimotonii]GBC62410.1 IclR family transcriptional regulator [Desulfonema ishimotonii]
MKQKQNNLNSVEKALRILLAFQPEHPIWGVRELAAHLDFSPATVQRILQTLKNNGFVDQDEQTRHYCLGNVYYKFLDTLQTNHPVTRAALPYMQQILSATQETVHLNIIQGKQRVCIDNIESPQDLKATMPLGNRSPLYAGASSKCLLAFSTPEFAENYLRDFDIIPMTDRTITDPAALRPELAQIRKQGYAESLGERIIGLGSLSAPVLDHRGLILAAISLALPEIRYKDRHHRKNCLSELCRAARSLSERMGYSDAAPPAPQN